MAVAFVFPGQGSQIVGMGKDLFEQFTCAKQVFEEVDDALEQKLSRVMFDGPNEDLTLTFNAQPALMAVSIAIIRVMEAQGLVLNDKVQFLAGHSLGEYSALCAAGSFSVRDTARLLRIRGLAMQEAVPVGRGAMAAIIGLLETEVEAVCQEAQSKGICQIANDNGAGQIVISGEKSAIEFAAKLASEKGAKRSVILPVSAPFHSILMQPAAQKMQEALAEVDKDDAVIDIIPNVKVAPERNINNLTALLVQQVTGRVRWRETIDWFGQNSVNEIYEIGSGKVLTGLIKRINKDIKALNVYNAEDIDVALRNLSV